MLKLSVRYAVFLSFSVFGLELPVWDALSHPGFHFEIAEAVPAEYGDLLISTSIANDSERVWLKRAREFEIMTRGLNREARAFSARNYFAVLRALKLNAAQLNHLVYGQTLKKIQDIDFLSGHLELLAKCHELRLVSCAEAYAHSSVLNTGSKRLLAAHEKVKFAANHPVTSYIQGGDIVLLKNRSPYHLFTEFSPGAFTHVAVATENPGELVDLQSARAGIGTLNWEDIEKGSLDFVVLRLEDKAAQTRLARSATSVIGNPAAFDLNFRLEGLDEFPLPLRGKKISTFCVGFLYLLLRDAGISPADFFPLNEGPAGGNTVRNFAQLGISVGDRFLSPSAVLFSPIAEVVLRKHPRVSKTEEISDEVYFHFARLMEEKTLSPKSNLNLQIQAELAKIIEGIPLLSPLIKKRIGIMESTDLPTAYRAAVVLGQIEALAEKAALHPETPIATYLKSINTNFTDLPAEEP